MNIDFWNEAFNVMILLAEHCLLSSQVSIINVYSQRKATKYET